MNQENQINSLSVRNNSIAHRHQENGLSPDYPSYANYPQFEDEDQGINLWDIWHVIMRRKLVIITIALFIFLFKLYATLSTQAIYRATGSIQINPESTGKVIDYSIEAGGDRLSGSDYINTQLELLKSQALARQVIDELGLEQKPQPKETKLEKPFFSDSLNIVVNELKDAIELVSPRQSSSGTEKLGKIPAEVAFLSNLTIARVSNSRLVKVKYDSTDPELAASIVNTLSNKFVSMNIERRLSSASYAEDFLNEQLTQARSKLQESETELVKYANKHGIIIISDLETGNTQPLSTQVLRGLNRALAEAERERISAESKYKQTAKSSRKVRIQDNPVIQELKQSRAKLQAEYQEKLSTYKPAYPLMVQLKNRIREINKQIKSEVQFTNDTSIDTLKADYKAAQQKENDLRQKLEKNKKAYMDNKNQSIQYNTLSRDVETNQHVYNELLQRIKEVGVAGSIGKNNLSIVDPAVTPYFRHKPDVKHGILLGLLFGLSGGIGFAFLLEFLDNTISSSEEIEKMTHSTMLGMLPAIKDHKNNEKNISLLSATDPNSPTAEAIRTLRTNLQFSTQEGMPKSLLITSSSPAEGKTQLAVNLATTLCQSGKTVLLIDCDLRKPAIHERLGISNHKGLTNYLTRQIDEEAATQPTEIEGLFAIPSGSSTPNPVELLSSDRMQDLLTLAYEKFDIIIIDSAPVMGLSDSLILSNHASATLFVIAQGQAKKKAIEDAYNRLKQAQAHIIGTVFTKVKYAPGNSYHYDYYYYYQNDKNGDTKHKRKKYLS